MFGVAEMFLIWFELFLFPIETSDIFSLSSSSWSSGKVLRMKQIVDTLITASDTKANIWKKTDKKGSLDQGIGMNIN